MTCLSLKSVVNSYMKRVDIREHCDRCLNTERWGGSVLLMVTDAAFTSVGLNYFTAVIPKVDEFSRKFVGTGRIKDFKGLVKADIRELRKVWKNRRSWEVARGVASCLTDYASEDRTALVKWAKSADLENWKKDPVGMVNGVGINTFQYLRMMGGIDTVMPDKIVKRVINSILEEVGQEPVNDDIGFVKMVEKIAPVCGYRPVELCWMTWMIQPEGEIIRMKKYSKLLGKI